MKRYLAIVSVGIILLAGALPLLASPPPLPSSVVLTLTPGAINSGSGADFNLSWVNNCNGVAPCTTFRLFITPNNSLGAPYLNSSSYSVGNTASPNNTWSSSEVGFSNLWRDSTNYHLMLCSEYSNMISLTVESSCVNLPVVQFPDRTPPDFQINQASWNPNTSPPNSGDEQSVTLSVGQQTGNDLVTLSITIQNLTTGQTYTLVTTNRTFSFSGLDDSSTYNVTIVARDPSGNVSTQNTQFTTGDRTPPSHPPNPSIHYVDQGPGSGDSQVVTASVPAQPGVSQYQFVLTDSHGVTVGIQLSATPQVQFNHLPDQSTYNVTVQTFDAAGNYSGVSAPQTIFIPDRTAPDLSSVPILQWKVPHGVGSNQTLSASFSQTLSTDIVKLKFFLYNAINHQILISSPTLNMPLQTYDFSGLADQSSYYVAFISEDTLGNISVTSGKSNIVAIPDLTPPAIPDITQYLGVWLDQGLGSGNTQKIKITGTLPADANRLQFVLYNELSVTVASQTLFSGSATFNALVSSANYKFRVSALDVQGNQSDYSPFSSMILVGDRLAPAIPSTFSLTWQDQGLNSGSTQKLQATAVFYSDVSQFQFEIQSQSVGVSQSAWSSAPVLFLNLPDSKTYQLRVKARDAAGNESAFSALGPLVTVLDRTAPAVPTVLSEVWQDQGKNSADTQKLQLSSNLPAGASQLQFVLMLNDGTVTYNDQIFSASTMVLLSSIPDQSTYNFKVKAFDAAGNSSSFSALSLPALFVPDRTAPAAVTPGDLNVNLSGLTTATLQAQGFGGGSGGTLYYQFSNDDGASWSALQVGTSYTLPIGNAGFKVRAKSIDADGNDTNAVFQNQILSTDPAAVVPVMQSVQWLDQGFNTADQQKILSKSLNSLYAYRFQFQLLDTEQNILQTSPWQSTCNYIFQSVADASSYQIRVQARSISGLESGWSSALSVVIDNRTAEYLISPKIIIYPHPVSTQAYFGFSNTLPVKEIELQIYSKQGQLLYSQKKTQVAPGENQTLIWNGTDQNGMSLGNGGYLYVMIFDTDSGKIYRRGKVAIYR